MRARCFAPAPWAGMAFCGKPAGHRGHHSASFKPYGAEDGFLATVEWHILDLRDSTMEAYAREYYGEADSAGGRA